MNQKKKKLIKRAEDVDSSPKMRRRLETKMKKKKIVNQVGWADAPLPIRFVQIKNETLPMAAKKKKKFDVDTNEIKKKWNLPISSVGSESIAATVST